MYKDELTSRLADLDNEAAIRYQGDTRFVLILVGGGALVLLDVITRATYDLDALAASPQLKELLDKYDINGDVSAYSDTFPFNYENRLERVFSGEKVDVFTASLEDIVISKLCAARDKDMQDIESDAVLQKLDWQLLDKLATDDGEIKANILNKHAYNMFKYNYDDYVRRCKPCES